MNKDSHLIFENYVDGVTKMRGQLAGNIMDIVKYGIPSKEEFIKIRKELHDLVNNRLKLGGRATEEEQDQFNELYGRMRAYRSQHPDDPPPSRDLSKEEDAEDTDKQGNAISILARLKRKIEINQENQDSKPFSEEEIKKDLSLALDILSAS